MFYEKKFEEKKRAITEKVLHTDIDSLAKQKF